MYAVNDHILLTIVVDGSALRTWYSIRWKCDASDATVNNNKGAKFCSDAVVDGRASVRVPAVHCRTSVPDQDPGFCTILVLYNLQLLWRIDLCR